MADAIGIGFFQFDNLVKTRVPFCLLIADGSFEKLYSGQELEHIRRYSNNLGVPVDIEQVLTILAARKHRPIDPILVVCSNGRQSQKIANEIEAHGYLNCYFITGGFEQLVIS